MTMLTADRLREVLRYDAETGLFTWRIRAGRQSPGSPAGRTDAWGYHDVRIDGRRYKAHRLAWLHVYGRWPAEQIDHINGIKDDNRIANLREATARENRGNEKRRRSNSSGFKGVVRTRNGRWMARIRDHGHYRYIGTFDTPEAAHGAYIGEAARIFGQFARAA